MIKINLHPEIFLIQDFLTKKECNHFIEKGKEEKFKKAKVNVHGKQVMIQSVRNNERVMFKDEELANTLWEKLKPFMPETFGKYKVKEVNELFRIYKYTKGQRFKMHRDGSFQRNDKECSFFSFLIYLNQDFEGGETYFERGNKITPRQGNALLFHHPLRHEGKAIISGTKYVLRTDVMYTL